MERAVALSRRPHPAAVAQEVVVGPGAATACLILAGATATYAIAAGFHAYIGIRRRYVDRWSAVVATAALFALAYAILRWGPAQIPAPLSPALLAVLVAAAIAVPLFTAWGVQAQLDRWGERMPRWLRWRMPDMSHEDRRKGPHLLMGLFVLQFPILGHLILAAIAALGPASAPAGEGWGNILALSDGRWFAAGQAVAIWLLLLLVYVLTPVELLRLRFPAHGYPFKRIIEPRLRERERGLFGAHLDISIGVALAVLFLGRDPDLWPVTVPAAMAVVAVTVFADAASALFGIRWGRRRWFHNPGKSYVGTLGGAVVALACCIPLVGVLPGILAALLFVAIDAVAPRPLPVSDNLLNPLGLAILFWALRDWLQPAFALP